MHPLLRGPTRLGAYLLLWALFGALPASSLVMSTPLGTGAAAAVMIPVTVLFGIATLPLWFVCLALPLHLHLMPPTRWLAAQAVVAGLWQALWLGLIASAMGLLSLLGGPPVPRIPWGPQAMLGLLFYGLSLAFHYLLRSIDSMRITQQEHAALVLAHRESALAALKAQVHPHFLFNSLNAISALVTQQPHKARDLCVHLADFLRQSLALGDQQRILLSTELHLVDHYLAIEQVRLGERLRVTMTIAPESTAFYIPPLLLQPLVENAIKHGIAPRDDGGTLHIEATCEAHRVHLRITNPLPPDGAPTPQSLGLGLQNVQRRLATLYGTRAVFKVQSTSEAFCVMIAWPCEGAHP